MDSQETVRAGLPDALKALRGLAVRFAGDGADDLLQATACRALDKAHQFTPGTNLTAWMYVILRSLFYSERRHHAKHGMPSMDVVPDVYLTVRPSQEHAVFLGEVEKKMARLSPTAQAVLQENALGYHYHEMADRKGVSIGTIKSRLWRAKARIKELVA